MQETEPLVPDRRRLILLAVLFEGGLVLLAWLGGLGLDLSPFRGLGSSWNSVALGIAASLPILAGVVGVRISRWGPLVRLREILDERVIPLFAHCTVIDLALISALAGLGEEALFRGLLQAWLEPGLGPGGAILLAGVLFGLAHPLSTGYAIYAGLVGIYLGVLFTATGDLTVPAVAHGAFDFLALLWLTRDRRAGAGGSAGACPG